MPRPKSVWWSDHEKCWMTTVGGEISPTTGRPRPRRNRDIPGPYGPDRAKNQRLAHEWFEKLVNQEAESIRPAGDVLFKHLVADYLETARDRVTARTLESHRERLATFSLFAGSRGDIANRKIRELKDDDVAEFFRKKSADGYATLYLNTILISVNACLNWATHPGDNREKYLDRNPFTEFRRPVNPAPEKRYAGPVAHRAFFDYAINRACIRHDTASLGWRFDRLTIALFRFCQETGCRPSEACRLEWSHIDWEASVAVIAGKVTKKTGFKRRIPIPETPMRMIRAIRNLPGRHEQFVFTHMRRDRATDEAGRLAGVPWTVNALDHKFRAWRGEAVAIGCPIREAGNSALTLYALRRDLGAEVLRIRGSHADSAEVLGHSPELNAKYYASFATGHALSLAEQVSRARRSSKVSGDPAP